LQLKNFRKILPSNGLGPGEVSQSGPKVLHLWRHCDKMAYRCKNRVYLLGFEELSFNILKTRK